MELLGKGLGDCAVYFAHMDALAVVVPFAMIYGAELLRICLMGGSLDVQIQQMRRALLVMPILMIFGIVITWIRMLDLRGDKPEHVDVDWVVSALEETTRFQSGLLALLVALLCGLTLQTFMLLGALRGVVTRVALDAKTRDQVALYDSKD